MKSYLFKVIFTGQLDDTLPVDIIRNKLAKLLNQNHKKVESFFNGKPFLIKNSVDQITAEKYRNTLKKAGAICIIKPEGEKQKETTQDSGNLKIISTKSTCKIVKLDIHRTDFRLSPLTCNLITSTSGGIKIHRPEKEAAKFSEILSVSICSQTGNIEDLQVLLFIKGLIRPVSAKPVNIRFSDFCENTAVSSIDSIKQFIKYLCNKSPDLIMDKNTYEFIFSRGGHLPKEDPNRLSTAMEDVLNPGKKKPADSSKTPFLKNQDRKKVDNESSKLAYHERIQDQEKSETDLSVQKTRQKTIPAGLRRNKFALLGRIALGIILIAVGCLWIGTKLNDTKEIAKEIEASRRWETYATELPEQVKLLNSFRDQDNARYKGWKEFLLRWNPKAKADDAAKQQWFEQKIQSRLKLLQKIRSNVNVLKTKISKQKQKLKSSFRVAAFILYAGFWIFFSGYGKMRAIKRYENQIETDPTAFDTDTAKHFLSGKFICAGILLLLFSATMISFSVEHMIDNLGKTSFVADSTEMIADREQMDIFMENIEKMLGEERLERMYIVDDSTWTFRLIDNLNKTFFVKASAGAFLLLIGAFLLYTGYKYTRPSINLIDMPASRKPQTEPDRRDPLASNHVKVIRDPVKVNLIALLHPKYILIGVMVLLAILLGNYYYQSSKVSKEYLRYNKTELEKYRVKFDFQRKEIFRQTFFASEDLIQMKYEECSYRSKDELIAGLHADDIDNTSDITACFARLRDPAIIEPFFMWYQKQLDASQYFSTSSMGDIIIVMKSKSVGPLSNALTSLENEKATDLAAKLLATIHTEESIRVLADAITENSFPAAHSAGRVLAIISSSPYIEIDKSFELVSLVYNFDDPGLRKIAIETLRIFDGTAVNDLTMAVTKDKNSEVTD